jgi:hypothetical protein
MRHAYGCRAGPGMSIFSIAFQDDLKAHQTARVLAEWQAKGRIDLTSAVIINRAPSGELVVRQIGWRHPEAIDGETLIGTLAGVPARALAALMRAIGGSAAGSANYGPGAGKALRAALASFVEGMTVIVADVATTNDAALTELCEGAGGTVQVL